MVETPEAQPLPEDFTAFKAARQGAVTPATSIVEIPAPVMAQEPPSAEPETPADGDKPSETEPVSEPEKKAPEETKGPVLEDAESKSNKAFVAMRKAIREAEKRSQALEAQTRDLEQQLAQLRAAKPPEAAEPKPADVPAKPADGEPVEDAFEDYSTYIRAWAKWEALRAVKQELAANEADNKQRRTLEAQQQVQRAAEATIAKGLRDHEDFEEVLSTSNVPMTPLMDAFMINHPMGSDIAYHLAKNPADAVRIAELIPAAQQRELAKLADSLSRPAPLEDKNGTPKAPAVSSAPRPPSIISGGPSPMPSSIYDERVVNDYSKWVALRRKQQAGR